MRRVLARLLLCCSAILASATSMAAGLQVAPVSLTLAATQNAEALWLSNTSDEVVHAQIRVYRWTQDEKGDQLTPTRDLLTSPPMLELAPGERHLVRAIRLATAPGDGAEHHYRLIIDELPVEGAAGGGLQYVLRYSVPVFVQPKGAPPSPPALQWALGREGDKWMLQVANSGGTRAQLADLAYTDAAGQRSVVAPGLLGYVLPGARMRWPLKVPSAAITGMGRWDAMINGQTGQSVPLDAPVR